MTRFLRDFDNLITFRFCYPRTEPEELCRLGSWAVWIILAAFVEIPHTLQAQLERH